ncbi:transcriptional regulator [Streptomyces sp. L2]|uniref:transcriptional regulator n=1 Tax=Streptomyces sp. L2 TaxID=2162665 RepID=UPI001010336F|nr:transcriptional regulator [Streptomyces sp. L2]
MTVVGTTPPLPVRHRAAVRAPGAGGAGHGLSPMLTRLAEERATGVLVREHGTLHLAEGRVVYAESPLAPGLDVLLTAHGTLAATAWQRAAARSAGPLDAAALLLDAGLLPTGALELCHLDALYDAAYFALAPSSTPGRFRYTDAPHPDAHRTGPGHPGRPYPDSAHPDAAYPGAPSSGPADLGPAHPDAAYPGAPSPGPGHPGPPHPDAHRTGPGHLATAQPGPAHPGSLPSVPVTALERETLRRRALLHRLWPDPAADSVPLIRADPVAAPPVTARRRAVLDRVDGVRTAPEIARDLGRQAFHTLVDVRRLAAAGHLRPVLAAPVPAPPPPPVTDPDIALLKRLRDALEAL